MKNKKKETLSLYSPHKSDEKHRGCTKEQIQCNHSHKHHHRIEARSSNCFASLSQGNDNMTLYNVCSQNRSTLFFSILYMLVGVS